MTQPPAMRVSELKTHTGRLVQDGWWSDPNAYYLASEADALLASRDARIAKLEALLRDCAEHFKTLREANVFVWPNHPMNPERRIAAALRARDEGEK